MANEIENSVKKIEESVKKAQSETSSYGNLMDKVNEYIRMGGRPEYQTATEHPKTYAKYYNPADKQLTGFDTFEYYKAADGTYTRDLSKIASISMDANGKVSVTIPDKWKDDSEVAKYTDSYILKSLASNYKKNKDVEYPDPYDENKKIKTEKYIELLNQGLKYRVKALDLTAPLKTELLKKFGGTKEKDSVINGMTTDDIITMSLEYDKDDSWLPIPAYMLEAYPEIAKLSSYANGFAKKADFLENFYNIENGSITERYAYGIARTPDLMLQEVEDMTPEEVAKTIAFGRFVSSFDPKRSPISQFLQDMDAKARGFYAALEEKAYGTIDLVSSVASLSLVTGTKPDTKSFMEGLFGEKTVSGQFDIAKGQMALTNKDAFTHAQRGYAEGLLAGQAVDTVVSMILVGEAVKAVSNAITTKIVKEGSSKIAKDLAGSIVPAEEALEVSNKAKKGLAGVFGTSGVKTPYQAFFSQTWSQSIETYKNAVKSIGLTLQGLNVAQLVNAANSAAKVATLAQYANTAVNLMGSMTMAALVGNRELTTKVLANRGTSSDTEELILSMLFDTAKYEWYGAAITEFGNVADSSKLVGAFKSSEVGQKVGEIAKNVGQKASKKMVSFENIVAAPWIKFRKWILNNKAAVEYAKKAASNSKIGAEEAIKEAVLVNEARAYGSSLSTVPESTGTSILGSELSNSGSAQGTFDAETLNWLDQNGIVFDAATSALSEFQNWKADYAEMQNALNNWGDISQNISQTVGEFTNPDIYPTISQNLSELKNANSALLKEETKAGLLTDKEAGANKSILSADASGYIYAMHSPELSRYLVRNYEASILKNEAKMKGVNPEKYEPYQNAVARLHAAAESVPERLRRIADDKYIPALKRAEHEIVDAMVSDGVYPKAFVNAMRQSGKYGKNGEDWMRLVAKQELPKGVYNPYSGTTKRDNTIALGNFKVLPDEDITWPGNGLQELIQEYGIARAEKKFLEASKKATGLTTDVVVSGKETAGAGKMKEFRSNLAGAVRQGFNSFTEDVEGTLAIGKKRALERKAFYDEIAITGGIGSMDMDVLRSIMKSKNLPMAEDIVDQPALDKIYNVSSDQGKKIITDTLGERIDWTSLNEEQWDEEWDKFSPEAQKILRGELEKTSLETGYGIKDTRGRLNSQVPGFDVLDWSLLGREHVNGLAPEIGYANMDDYGTKAYIMDLEDLRNITGLNRNKEDMSPDAINKIEKDINTRGAGAVLPLYYAPVGGQNKFFMMTRWGHSGDRFPDWETYFNYLESKGIKKVPVALNYYKRSLTHDALSQRFFKKLDKATATGKKPKITPEELAVALRTLGSKGKVANRITSAYPSYDRKELDELLTKGEQYNASVSLGLKKDKFNIDFEKQLAEGISNFNSGKEIDAKDITEDLGKAFSEYGQIPLYHNQSAPLGSVEPNSLERFPTTREGKLFDNNGAGDALWLAPNASYTDQYGENKVVGTIPVEYFLSDRAKDAEITKIYKRLVKLENKLHDVLESSDLKIKNDDELKNATLSRLWDAEREGLAENLEDLYPGELKKAKDLLEKSLTKKELKEYKELSNIYDINNISGNGLAEVDKHSIKSYRALAERLNKPIIDISRDGWADGTAYFYYKGVSPEFDKRLGEQLSIQANAKPNESTLSKKQLKELEAAMEKWAAVDPQNFANVPTEAAFEQPETVTYEDYQRGASVDAGLQDTMRSAVENAQFNKLQDLKENDTSAYEMFLEKLDRANASVSAEVRDSNEAKASAELYKQDIEDLEKSTIFNEEFSYLAQPEAEKGTNALKYDLDKDALYADIDDAIDGLIGVVTHDAGAMAAVEGIADFQGVELSEPRLEFIVLGEILGDEGKDLFGKAIEVASHKIVDGIIGKKKVIVKGNLDALYKKVEGTINDKLETRFAAAKTQLESMGEPAESETITKLLDKYREEIMDAKADPLVVKTTDANGEIQFERVSPTIADIYNNRPVYNPISTPKQILMNLALVKKISTTDLSPRSFMKQSVSDPAMAFATVGVLPGTLSTMRDEIKYTFGQSVLSAIEKNDPIRYSNIQAIAARDNISEAEALMKNLKATADVQVPFTLLNQEILRRANVSKYGNQAAMDMARRGLSEKINGGLRKASDVLGTPQNKREAYFRILAGEKAYLNALKDGYSQQQAEVFREHAINTATTNFRLKITIFNNLRSTVPYLTSGISGFRSFWKMFELDPVGVTSRIFTGFILPIIFFMGEIVSNKELREKYATLAESEKANHIVIPVGGDFILIPVGEELGNYVNMVTHVVETLYGSNKYDFWNLMLNDFVGLAPLDLTGFVDPDLLSQNPDLGEIIESGIGRVIAQTTPPIVQTAYIINTGKDPYTGKDLTNDYYSVDEDGNLVRMTQTSSQFAKALATMVGGDARVIEKIASGLMGPTFLHTLDTITSAVDFAGSGGQSGSLTTAIDKFMEDATKPFTAVGYDSMDRRFSSEVNRLFRKKEAIESSDEYKKYNTEISKEKDSNRRRTLINKRNDLITDYKNRVEEMVKRYRDAGLMLDKSRFSKVVSLIVFEDALRADRQYMDLNTNYSDAYKQAMQTLYEMGIENPEGPSTLGYIYTDSDGKPQLKMYTPTQMQIVQSAFYGQREIHRAQIEGIFNDGTANSLKNKRDQETKAEQKYWDKYNATGKLSSDEWDAIDDLRKAYNAEVVLALQDYMDTYGAENVLSSEDVMNYLVDNVIKVPSSEEKVNGRYVSSSGGKLDKQEGFGPYYIKKIFGVVK